MIFDLLKDKKESYQTRAIRLVIRVLPQGTYSKG